MALTATSLAALGLLVLLFLQLRPRSVKVPKGLRLPPAPRGLPLLGNTLQLELNPKHQLRQWARTLGDVFSLKIGGYNFVLLCSPEAIKGIMDKQAAATSSRPPFPASHQAASGGMRTLLMEYNPRWRKLRTIVHKLTTPKVSDSMRPSQEFEAKQLAYDILTDNAGGDNFYRHCRRYTTSVVMTATYGKRIPTWENEDVKQVYQIMRELSLAAPPFGFLADTFPILLKLPMWMQTWRKRAAEYYKHQEDLWTRLFEELKTHIAEGVAPDCFVKQLIETDLKKNNVSDIEAAFVSGSMIEAGSETTASSLNTLLKHIAAYPRVQDVANEELTRVTLTRCSVRAITREIMRLKPPSRNVGVPHYSTEDVIYKDFFIPKGTMVTLAQLVVQNDDRYDDPFEFRPERFMKNNYRFGQASTLADAAERDHFSFGVGRRICPGLHIAENSLFITVAKILWAFELKPPLDANGKEEPIDISDDAFEEGTILVPRVYRLRFVPRSPGREKVIRHEWEQAKRDGFWLGDIKVTVDGMLQRAA
ncbi:hypothetical protein BDV12DRAFT_207858 [Aspergillus spectabilis]